MTPYIDDMNQEATYWAATGEYQFGNAILDVPILISCRWQDQAVQFRSSAGETLVSSAVVYSDRELTVHGWIALGDHTTFTDPTSVPDAWIIRQTGSSPDLDAQEVLHKNWL